MPVVAEREHRAFQDLARAHLPRLYGLARRLAGRDAEDLVQETLVRAFKSYEDLKSPQAAGAWFSTIMVNCARDRLRKEGRSVREVSLEELDEFSLYRHIAEEDPFPIRTPCTQTSSASSTPRTLPASWRRFRPTTGRRWS